MKSAYHDHLDACEHCREYPHALCAGGAMDMSFTEKEALRVVEAAWGIHHLLPHPDNVWSLSDAAALREFIRAIMKLPPLPEKEGEK